MHLEVLVSVGKSRNADAKIRSKKSMDAKVGDQKINSKSRESKQKD